MPAKANKRSDFGNVRQLPSGKFQARYTDPDGKSRARTFVARADARRWLVSVESDLSRGVWVSPDAVKPPVPTVAEYGAAWIEQRTVKPATRRLHWVHYRRIVAGLGDYRLDEVRPDMVRSWVVAQQGGPTVTRGAYALLVSIYRQAVEDELVDRSPCRASSVLPVHEDRKVTLPTDAQLATLVEAMPERLRPAVLLGAFGGLRAGEVLGLTRGDVDLAAGTVRVERTVTRQADGSTGVGSPKTRASRRTVALPPSVVAALRDHLARFVGPDAGALLFPSPSGTWWRSSRFGEAGFHAAREAAGLPDLHFHDLRHFAATLATRNGATLREVMARLGHTSVGVAMLYQEADQQRDRALADALDASVVGVLPANVVRLDTARARRGVVA